MPLNSTLPLPTDYCRTTVAGLQRIQRMFGDGVATRLEAFLNPSIEVETAAPVAAPVQCVPPPAPGRPVPEIEENMQLEVPPFATQESHPVSMAVNQPATQKLAEPNNTDRKQRKVSIFAVAASATLLALVPSTDAAGSLSKAAQEITSPCKIKPHIPQVIADGIKFLSAPRPE